MRNVSMGSNVYIKNVQCTEHTVYCHRKLECDKNARAPPIQPGSPTRRSILTLIPILYLKRRCRHKVSMLATRPSSGMKQSRRRVFRPETSHQLVQFLTLGIRLLAQILLWQFLFIRLSKGAFQCSDLISDAINLSLLINCEANVGLEFILGVHLHRIQPATGENLFTSWRRRRAGKEIGTALGTECLSSAMRRRQRAHWNGSRQELNTEKGKQKASRVLSY